MTHYKGNYSKYLELKAEQLASEWKAYEKQQEEINKLEDFVAKNLVRASTTKRAQSRRKVLEKMDRLDRPQGDEKSAHFLSIVKSFWKCCFTSRRCRHWLRPRTYFIRTYSLGYSSQRSHCLSRTERNW